MKKPTILILLFLLMAGCASGGGEAPQPKVPQAAIPHEQPTIKPLGSTTHGHSNLIPDETRNEPIKKANSQSAEATPTLITDRPSVLPATPTTSGARPLTETMQEKLEQAQRDAIVAETLSNDCTALATRELAEGWEVDCTLLHENMSEANRRLEEMLQEARK